MKEVVTKTIAENTAKSLPRGTRGLQDFLNIFRDVLCAEYPQIEPRINQLVTSTDQLVWSPAPELDKVKKLGFDDLKGFRLLVAAGASRTLAEKTMLDSTQEVFFDRECREPKMYLPRNAQNKLEAGDPVNRALNAVIITINIFEGNIKLLPEPKKIDGDTKSAALSLIKEAYNHILERMAKEIGDNITAQDFEAIENVMDHFFGLDDTVYPKSLIGNGGMVDWVLPNQTLNGPEVTLFVGANRNFYYHLMRPVLDNFLSEVKAGGYMGSNQFPLTRQTIGFSEAGEKTFRSLSLEEKDEKMDEYMNSNLALRLLRLRIDEERLRLVNLRSLDEIPGDVEP